MAKKKEFQDPLESIDPIMADAFSVKSESGKKETVRKRSTATLIGIFENTSSSTGFSDSASVKSGNWTSVTSDTVPTDVLEVFVGFFAVLVAVDRFRTN